MTKNDQPSQQSTPIHDEEFNTSEDLTEEVEHILTHPYEEDDYEDPIAYAASKVKSKPKNDNDDYDKTKPFMFSYIIKENGKMQQYDRMKGISALLAAMQSIGKTPDEELANRMVFETEQRLFKVFKGEHPTSKEWADACVKVLKDKGMKDLAEAYKDMREQKSKNRLRSSNLMGAFDDVLGSSGDDPDSVLTENANISGFDPAAQLHRIGSETNKNYVLDYIIPQHLSKSHREKWLHIHDLDFFELNFNCLNFDLASALEDGFDTGTGLNDEPHSVMTAAALAAVLIQSLTNQQHGGIAILNFDFALAKYVNISFRKEVKKVIKDHYRVDDKDVPFVFSKRFFDRLYYGIEDDVLREALEDALKMTKPRLHSILTGAADDDGKVTYTVGGDTFKDISVKLAEEHLCQELGL